MYTNNEDPQRTLNERIGQAITWRSLENICVDIDAAFLGGNLTHEGLESLCQFVSHRARSIDEPTGSATVSLRDVSQCDCCGSAERRDNGGQMICAICHPDPLRHRPQRRAA